MTSVKRFTQWVILGMKHSRIWVPPTQFQKSSKNFKIEFQGNWTKTLISPESAWLTDLVPIFWKEKTPTQKIIPIFNSGIQPKHQRFYSKWFIIQDIWVYFESKFTREFKNIQMFRIRQRNIFKTRYSLKCVGKN